MRQSDLCSIITLYVVIVLFYHNQLIQLIADSGSVIVVTCPALQSLDTRKSACDSSATNREQPSRTDRSPADCPAPVLRHVTTLAHSTQPTHLNGITVRLTNADIDAVPLIT